MAFVVELELDHLAWGGAGWQQEGLVVGTIWGQSVQRW